MFLAFKISVCKIFFINFSSKIINKTFVHNHIPNTTYAVVLFFYAKKSLKVDSKLCNFSKYIVFKLTYFKISDLVLLQLMGKIY